MTDVVIDVAISPDGTKAISTAYFDPDETGNEAILWDTETFEVIHRLPGFFVAAEFLPDGRSAILGGNATGNDVENPEMLLVHWDLESGAELKRKESTEISEAFDIALSPDSSSLLFGARGLMQQFDVETFTEMTSFPAASEDEWLVSVAFSPDGQTAIAGGDLGDLILYDLDTGEEIRRYNQGGASYGLDISADGERFVSGGSNHTAVLWDVASGEAIQTFNGHTSGVDGVAFTPDESQIITGSADGTLILWDVATGEALRTFSEHGASASIKLHFRRMDSWPIQPRMMGQLSCAPLQKCPSKTFWPTSTRTASCAISPAWNESSIASSRCVMPMALCRRVAISGLPDRTSQVSQRNLAYSIHQCTPLRPNPRDAETTQRPICVSHSLTASSNCAGHSSCGTCPQEERTA